MKKRFLTGMNLLLGAASVALIGCHSQKATSSKADHGKVVAKYGVPVMRTDTIPSQVSDTIPTEQTDSIQQAPRPAGGKILVKYGVPPTRTEK